MVPQVARNMALLINASVLKILGGKGSGNFGHGGRPGEVGGSAPSEDENVAYLESGGKQVHLVEGGAQSLVSKKGSEYKVTFQYYSGRKATALRSYTSAREAVQVARGFLKDTPKFGKEPLTIRHLGGAGSGNYNHGGRPGEVGGSSSDSERAQRALAAHNPFSRKKEALATKNENEMVVATHGSGTDDNHPMDIIVRVGGKTYGVEVKTMMDNKASKVTMRKDALQRKVAWARSNHASLHTVIIDDRKAYGRKDLYSGHRLYYQKGIGSFRLSTMTKVKDAQHLRALLTNDRVRLRRVGA